MDHKDPDALDQDQADAILNRAIELKHARAESGLSMTDVEAVAVELGVEPHFVQAAAAELARPSKPDATFTILGASTRIVREHTLDGPPDKDDADTVFDLARQHAGTAGRIKKHGGAMTWHGGRMRVTVLSQKRRSRVLVTSSMGGLAVSLFVPILIPTALAIIGLTIPLGVVYGAVFTPIFFGLLGFAVAFQGVRMLFASAARNRRREVSELMAAIVANTERGGHTLPAMSESRSSEAPSEVERSVEVEA